MPWTHICAHTDFLKHMDTCPLVPPSLSPGSSPGVGRMDGLGVLVTGFTRATASLGTCPHPKENAQGVQGWGRSSSRAMPFRGSWFLRLPGGPTVFHSVWARPDSVPHLRARCCYHVAHLPLQDHQGFLVGVWPLHKHPPAVLPGRMGTEFLSPSQAPRVRALFLHPVTVRENPEGFSQRSLEGSLGRHLRGRGHGSICINRLLPSHCQAPGPGRRQLPTGWGRADLRALGCPPWGGCWYCLTMFLICCVGCGKCSELSVEYRTSSGQGKAVGQGAE